MNTQLESNLRAAHREIILTERKTPTDSQVGDISEIRIRYFFQYNTLNTVNVLI